MSSEWNCFLMFLLLVVVLFLSCYVCEILSVEPPARGRLQCISWLTEACVCLHRKTWKGVIRPLLMAGTCDSSFCVEATSRQNAVLLLMSIPCRTDLPLMARMWWFNALHASDKESNLSLLFSPLLSFASLKMKGNVLVKDVKRWMTFTHQISDLHSHSFSHPNPKTRFIFSLRFWFLAFFFLCNSIPSRLDSF